jgi:GMP synthase (glutamine-hydrolysing)
MNTSARRCKALAVTHVAFEDLGTLAPALRVVGCDIEVVDACTTRPRSIDPLAPDVLVVLGGPIGVYETQAYPFLADEVSLLRERLAAQRPTLGICLGAQLIAAALGSSVHPGERGMELGWGAITAAGSAYRHAWFAPLLDPSLRLLHWHGDTFELPAKAELLASTERYAHQAFAVGRHALGLQFHPEVTVDALERWYVGHACELAQAGVDVATLREACHLWGPALEVAAGELWRGWLCQALNGA